MKLQIPLDQMTLEEKLEAMEELWSDISGSGSDYPSPAWHGDVLNERTQAIQEGRMNVSSFEEAAARLRALGQKD